MNFINTKIKQGGASLVELMVAVFIFSIGVLGFASLQTRSLQATFDNGQRDQVVWLTQSLIDRVRVNSGPAAVANYATEVAKVNPVYCNTAPAALCDAAVCSTVQMSTFDVWDLYCSNQFQGADAISDLSVTLTCTDGTCDTVAENLLLSSTWCPRGIETDTSTNCDGLADADKITFDMGFRP